MSALQVASVYVAINILMLVWFGLRVVARRFRGKISMGDGGSEDLARAIRVHDLQWRRATLDYLAKIATPKDLLGTVAPRGRWPWPRHDRETAAYPDCPIRTHRAGLRVASCPRQLDQEHPAFQACLRLQSHNPRPVFPEYTLPRPAAHRRSQRWNAIHLTLAQNSALAAAACPATNPPVEYGAATHRRFAETRAVSRCDLFEKQARMMT